MNVGTRRVYNKNFKGRNDVIHWDVLKIKPEQELYLDFISVNSQYKQGVRLAIDAGEGYIEAGEYKGKGIFIWEDTFEGRIKIKCHSPEGLLSVYNAFIRNDGRRVTLAAPSGMLIETNGNKTIYRCNDVGFETNFDKLIFQIELL
ncbi:MAG: hypothetical protein ACI3YE_06865 [Candidatus Avispirillum sp.]